MLRVEKRLLDFCFLYSVVLLAWQEEHYVCSRSTFPVVNLILNELGAKSTENEVPQFSMTSQILGPLWDPEQESKLLLQPLGPRNLVMHFSGCYSQEGQELLNLLPELISVLQYVQSVSCSCKSWHAQPWAVAGKVLYCILKSRTWAGFLAVGCTFITGYTCLCQNYSCFVA